MTKIRKTVVGDIKYNTYASSSGDAELSITASALPDSVTAVTTDDVLYRKARHELLTSFGAKKTSWKTCRHRGHDCRTLGYETPDARHGLARLYLEDDVLVVLNAVYGDDADAAKRFLSSAR